MTQMTTAETITTEQIEQLRSEAAEAGDDRQVEVCRQAVHGHAWALAECVAAIRDAEAMQD